MVSSGDLFYDWANISLLERITCQVVCETLDTNTVRVHDRICGAEGCRERLCGCGSLSNLWFSLPIHNNLSQSEFKLYLTVFCEENAPAFSSPKSDVAVLSLPSSGRGTLPFYVATPGVSGSPKASISRGEWPVIQVTFIPFKVLSSDHFENATSLISGQVCEQHF